MERLYIPFKYYNPSNNINIRNYLSENNIKYKCPSNAYLSLNELLEIVDGLNYSEKSNINLIDYNFERSKNEIIIESINKNEKQFGKQIEFSEDAKKRVFINKTSTYKQPYYRDNGKNNSNYRNCGNYQNNNNYQNCVIVSNNNEICSSNSTLSKPNESKNITHENKMCVQTSLSSVNNNDSSLLKNLLECRSNLSKWNNIDPEKVISTKNLKLLLLHRPNSIDDIKNLNLTGFGEDKIRKYGYDFLDVFLLSYCEKNKEKIR
ncbi:conserved Plasmodium protein, unknown function [Plasmodium malariae]|uniref:HRDC domain-containing protein n=1 Tax=Plasmodium malariae TaxID=5858 RepID=A0A1C3KFE1_PLAMA|nr:conserved Plasmodium protein, unknown function [Plasmodium malariae]